MLIKTLRCHEVKGINRLVDYIISDKDRIQNMKDTFFIAHNMYGDEAKHFKEAFNANDQYRKKRKRGVVAYHEVLAFSPSDKVSLKELEELSLKYIELRASDALVLAKPHVEDGHYHVHFLISGTACCSSKVMRLNNKVFKKLQKDMELYQIKQYPHLTNSIVYLTAKEQERTLRQKQDQRTRKDKEVQTKKRLGKYQKLDKEKLGIAVSQMVDYSQSKVDFFNYLQQQNLIHYYYREKLAGVIYKGRKYRFTTLGIAKEKLLSLPDLPQKNRFKGFIKELISKDKDSKEWVKTYQERLFKLQILEEKKQLKHLKILIQNILDKSFSFSQFIYFCRATGLYSYQEKGIVKGISFCYKQYSFLKLGLLDKVLNLQKLEQKRKDRKLTKEQDQYNNKLESSMYWNIGLDFLF